MAPTLRDVAALADVSYGTVARVVHKKGEVAEGTRKRVLEAIAQLDYRPNAIARSLRKRKSFTVGVVVSNILNPRFAGELKGVQEVVEEEGYQTILGNTDESTTKEGRYLELMMEQRVDGLVLIPSGAVSLLHIRRMQAAGIPVVLLNRYHEGVDRAVSDNAGGARLALAHLIELGHRRIGVIVSPTGESSSGGERVSAYRKTLKAAGIDADPSLIAEAGFDDKSGFEAATSLLGSSNPPTAVLAMASFLTLGTMRAIRELELRVPQDLSLIGFNEVRWAPFLSPPLTVVSDDSTEMGREAARILFRRIKGEGPPEPVETRIPARLDIREFHRTSEAVEALPARLKEMAARGAACLDPSDPPTFPLCPSPHRVPVSTRLSIPATCLPPARETP